MMKLQSTPLFEQIRHEQYFSWGEEQDQRSMTIYVTKTNIAYRQTIQICNYKSSIQLSYVLSGYQS